MSHRSSAAAVVSAFLLVLGAGFSSAAGALSPGNGAFAGTLTVAGAPGDGWVGAFMQDATDGFWYLYDAAPTAADGSYTLEVPAGTYRICFDSNDAQFAATCEGARTVDDASSLTLTAGETKRIDHLFATPGRISGTVSAGGTAAAGTWVAAFENIGGEWVDVAYGQTGSAGSYVIAVDGGTYRVGFDGGTSFATEYWDDAPKIDYATSLSVAAGGSKPGINAALATEPPAVANTVKPTISDPTPETGQVLSATSGTWSPAGATYAYQWLAGGTAISGATSTTYTVADADQGKALTVRVTASKADYTDGVVTSDPTSAVVKPVFTNTAKPTISDTTPTSGQTLTATTGSWTPSGATYAFQWLADGEPITGATTASHQVPSGEVGKSLSVRVTATKAGTTTGIARSEMTSPVAQPIALGGTITNSTKPAIDDTTPQVGQTLTASGGTWSQTGVTLAWRWFADGELISGALAQTYTVAAADEGKALSVRVTASKNGANSGAATSDPTGPVISPVTTGQPTISGTPRVGSPLQANAGATSPSDATTTFQWYAKGAGDASPVALAGATAATYTPVAGDYGKALTVVVTATKAGRGSATSVPSAATAPVAAGKVTSTGAPVVTGTPLPGGVLSVSNGTWSVEPSQVTWQWFADGLAIAGATGSTFTVPSGYAGRLVSAVVSASAPPAYAAGRASSNAVAVGHYSFTVSGTAKIIGKARKGKVLLTTTGSVSPSPTATTYQWRRNGVDIPGATGSSYKLTKKDKRKRITVVVTHTRADYATVVQVSAPTKKVK